MISQLFFCVWKISVSLILTGKVSPEQFRKLKKSISSSSANIYQVPAMGSHIPSPLEKPHSSKGETPGNPLEKSLDPWTQRKGVCVAKEPILKMHLAILFYTDLFG